MPEPIQHIDTKLMQDYLQGKLSTEQRKAVDDFLAENPFYAEAMQGLSDSAVSSQWMTDVITINEKVAKKAGLQKKAKVFGIHGSAWKLAAAAIIFITVGLGVYLSLMNPFSDQKNEPIAQMEKMSEAAELNPSPQLNEADNGEKMLRPNVSEESVPVEIADNESGPDEQVKESFDQKVVEDQLAKPESEDMVSNPAVSTSVWYANDKKALLKDTLTLAYRSTDSRSSGSKKTENIASVRGRILDVDSKKPISGANVLFDGNKAISSINGEFSLVLPKGKQELVVFSPGYAEESKKFYLAENENKDFTIYLKQTNDLAANSPASGSSVIMESSIKPTSVTAASEAKEDIAMARVDFNAGDYDDAAAHYEEALKKDPSSAESLLNAGIAYFNTGNYSKASGKLESALKNGAEPAKTKLYLGKTYLKKGNKAAAQKLLMEVKNSNTSYSKEAEQLLKTP